MIKITKKINIIKIMSIKMKTKITKMKTIIIQPRMSLLISQLMEVPPMVKIQVSMVQMTANKWHKRSQKSMLTNFQKKRKSNKIKVMTEMLKR